MRRTLGRWGWKGSRRAVGEGGRGEWEGELLLLRTLDSEGREVRGVRVVRDGYVADDEASEN